MKNPLGAVHSKVEGYSIGAVGLAKGKFKYRRREFVISNEKSSSHRKKRQVYSSTYVQKLYWFNCEHTYILREKLRDESIL